MPAGELVRTSGEPLWRQVQADLRARIDAAEFPDLFPGEKVLAEEYGVSRQTMRLALRSLRESGVVSAQRGRAPRVGAGVIEQPLGALYSLFASVEGAGMSQRSIVVTLDRRREASAARALQLPARTWLVHLERIRLADDEPLAIDRVWLPDAIAHPLLDADFTHTALYREMAQRCGVQPGGGQEMIRTVNLDATDAERLGTTPGQAAFLIDRLSCAGDRPLEWRTTLVRGDRFSISAQFSPSTGYRLGPPADLTQN